MLDGRYGKAAKWAIECQQQVGDFLDAEEFVEVRSNYEAGPSGLAALFTGRIPQDLKDFFAEWGGEGEQLDVAALVTPQLITTQVMRIAELPENHKIHPDTTLLIYSAIEGKVLYNKPPGS
ncbi:MAG: hypothetical protein JW852_12075 [Spirochaetales bacterium]|nr:hypothetical protein [Spirochaetales bacterium]